MWVIDALGVLSPVLVVVAFLAGWLKGSRDGFVTVVETLRDEGWL